MGAAELCRLFAAAATWAFRWIRDGDLQDARARAWAELATADDGAGIDPDVRKDAVWALAERRFYADPPGWAPPFHLAPATTARQARQVGALVLALAVTVTGIIAMRRAWDARDNNPGIAISGWAAWNYSGYEQKAAYPQYKAIIDAMSDVADRHGNGRALWEPSSGEPDAINSYGTSLALMLLPYFTDGRISSMEGIYFESSATTAYHFLTVSECAKHPSNPVRGEKYGTLEDFDLCVRHLQMLGVRYLMVWTDDAIAKADAHEALTLVEEIPQDPPISGPANSKLSRWRVYIVAHSDLVVGLDREPVVVTNVRGGSYQQCWGSPPPDPTAEPHLPGWECLVAPWWRDRDRLDVVFAQSGPPEWQRVDARALGSVGAERFAPVAVSDVRRSVDRISFRVSDVGRPVLVRESYFPNWKVRGAKGPYRLAPNLMVVVPTSPEVTLYYGLTGFDWLGRAVTLLGLAGLAGLAGLGWWGRRGGSRRRPDGGEPEGGDGPGEGPSDSEPDPRPRRWEPAALP
jgi:hypothetical protein